MIQNNIDKNWNYHSTNFNEIITIQLVLDNIKKPWNWHAISHLSKITIKSIINNPNLPWDWVQLSKNPNITIEDIINNPMRPSPMGGIRIRNNQSQTYCAKQIVASDSHGLTENSKQSSRPIERTQINRRTNGAVSRPSSCTNCGHVCCNFFNRVSPHCVGLGRLTFL